MDAGVSLGPLDGAAGLGRSGLLAWVEREAFPLAISALYFIVLLLAMPAELVQDSWSTLVAGREIVAHGLPRHETLTVMSQGVRWVDQQWLAQWLFYELFRAGGYRLILLLHVALLGSAFGLAIVAARRRGASPSSVFIVASLCAFVAPWGWQLRAQSFAPLLFVGTLWLLVEDRRAPSRRALLVLPLLVLWANLHGSVVLGVTLVALYGLDRVIAGRASERWKGVALLALAPATIVCSPYAASLPGYYRQLLIDPPFARLVSEWTAPTPGAWTAIFYGLAFATVFALGKWGRALTVFERAVLLVTLASALHATRNIVWFGFAVLILAPRLLEEARPRSGSTSRPGIALGLGLAAIALAAVTVVVVGAKPSSWYTREWPQRASAAVAAAAAPSGRVFASDRLADWLLWREPQLRGRVAFDIRFELNTAQQIRQLHRYFGRIGPRWRDADRGYGVIALNRDDYENVRRALLRDGGTRQPYLDSRVAVLTSETHR